MFTVNMPSNISLNFKNKIKESCVTHWLRKALIDLVSVSWIITNQKLY